jgi:hypothetical protein
VVRIQGILLITVKGVWRLEAEPRIAEVFSN